METNGKMGGICECLHNTEGFRCDKCKLGFYRDLKLPFSHPDSCKGLLIEIILKYNFLIFLLP